MNLKEAILEEHSKAQALKITAYIGSSQKRFDELMTHFFADDWRLNQCTAYSMNFVVAEHPHLFKKHLKKAIDNLRQPKHDAVKRNTLKILENIEIPEKHLGHVVDMCFDFLASHDEPVAIKAYSMGILFKVGKKEPDLFHELKVLIEDQMPTGTPGFTSRGRKYLKYINEVL